MASTIFHARIQYVIILAFETAIFIWQKLECFSSIYLEYLWHLRHSPFCRVCDIENIVFVPFEYLCHAINAPVAYGASSATFYHDPYDTSKVPLTMEFFA